MPKSYEPKQTELKYLYDIVNDFKEWKDKHNITQNHIVKISENSEFKLSQDEISRLLNVIKKNPDGTYELDPKKKNRISSKLPFLFPIICSWCEGLGTSIWKIHEEIMENTAEFSNGQICTNQEFYHKNIFSTDKNGKTDAFITSPTHPFFRNWLGEYYTRFSSTSSDEQKAKTFFDGKMRIFADVNDSCSVDFRFIYNQEAYNSDNSMGVKTYSGSLSLNNRAAYMTLVENSDSGDVAFIIFPPLDLSPEHKALKVALGLILTVSSTPHKRRPCCERIIISAKEIPQSGDKYDFVNSHLKLNRKKILISETDYQKLASSVDSNSPEALQRFIEVHSDFDSFQVPFYTVTNHISIEENVLREELKDILTSEEISIILSRLRSIDTDSYVHKVKESIASELFYELY